MKFPYLASTILTIAVGASSALAKTTTEEPQSMAPFVKKKEAVQRIAAAPKPFPAPQSYGTRRTTIAGRNYLGLELGMTSSTLFNAENYFVTADYDQNTDDAFAGLVPVALDEYQPGIGLMVHGVLDLAFNETVGLQAKVGYRNHTMGGTGRDTVDFDADGFTDTDVENNYTKQLNYLGVDALLRYQFAEDGLYGLAGFGFSSLLSNHSEGTQDDVNSDAQGTFAGELKDYYNSSRFDIKLGVGTWLGLGDGGWVLAPELMVGIPVTGLFTSQTEQDYKDFGTLVGESITMPNMLYASLGIAIKFPLGGNSSDVASSSSSSGDYSSMSNTQNVEAGKAMLSGRVVDNAGNPIDDAQVTVVDLNNNQVVATDKTDDGMYNVKVNAPGRYSVSADAPGYLFGSALYEVDKDGRILKSSGDIKLSPSTNGRVRLLVFFDFDKATLQPASYPELNRAVALMKANPIMRVEIAGFTDAQGTDSYNKDLSQRRANAVREYLVRQGVEGSRLTAVGYGEENPVASNDTEEGRAENRRVEFVVIKR